MELIPSWYLYLHKPSAWPSYIDAQGVVSACSAGHVGMQREVACNKAEAVQGMQRGATSTLPVLNQALDIPPAGGGAKAAGGCGIGTHCTLNMA